MYAMDKEGNITRRIAKWVIENKIPLNMKKDDKLKIANLIITKKVFGETAEIQFRWGESLEIKAKGKKKHFCAIYFY